MTAPPAAGGVLEAVRDRELRRLDWRFLRPGVPIDHLTAPSRSALRSLVAQSPPGRSVWLEWRRPVFSGGRRLRARLRSAGLEDIALYWPYPGLARPWFWLPLGSEAALGYIRESRLPAQTMVRRTVDRPLRALWRWAAKRELLWPLGALARVPGLTPNSDDLLARIRREWATWGLGPPPDRVTWMLLTRGPRSINKVVGLVFAEPDPAPRMVVKLPRVPEVHAALEREAAALAAVHARIPGGLKGAPRVLFCDQRSGGLALGETALPGRPLFSLLTSATYRELAFQAVDWLINLAGPLAAEGSIRAGQLVEDAFREFAATFGAVVDSADLRATERLVGPLAELPSVPEHRDFSPWNLHVAPGGGLVAYDWESAVPAGLPLNDLVYFLAYLTFFKDQAIQRDRKDNGVQLDRCLESYRRARDPATVTGAVHRECIARYARGVGLDPMHERGLHLLTWIIHSHSEYRRLTADAGGKPTAASLRRSLFLALWREELHR
jgi:Phosphotransferase enzyme family